MMCQSNIQMRAVMMSDHDSDEGCNDMSEYDLDEGCNDMSEYDSGDGMRAAMICQSMI